MLGPAKGCRKRVRALRGLDYCPAFDATLAQAQTLTSKLLGPVRDGFVSPQDSRLRRISDQTGDKIADFTSDDRLAGNDESYLGRFVVPIKN
jgi:hypothetical protein